jgi:hypothetical protein
MKHFFKLTCAAAILTAGIITLSIVKKEKERDNKPALFYSAFK